MNNFQIFTGEVNNLTGKAAEVGRECAAWILTQESDLAMKTIGLMEELFLSGITQSVPLTQLAYPPFSEIMEKPYCYKVRFGNDIECGGGCEECLAMDSISQGEVQVARQSDIEGRMFETRVFPITSDDGEVIGEIEISSDVTEETKMQQATFRSKQLASLGELAAGVAHEINNPINGIINYAQLLLMDEKEDSRIGMAV